MKHLLIFIFALIATTFTVDAQRFTNTEAIRLKNGNEQTAKNADGTIYYDIALAQFRFRENGSWLTLGGGGGGSLADGDYGNISVTGGGSIWTIDNGVVTLPKLQTVSTNIFLGRTSSGTGAVEQLTPAEAMELLPQFNSTTKGVVPLSGGGTTNFLRADGTWADPGASGGGSTETASNLLNKVGSDIRLGGSQTTNTVLNLSANGQTEFSILDPFSNKYGIIRDSDYGFAQGIHYVAGDFVSKVSNYSRFTPESYMLELYNENSANESVKLQIGAGGTSLSTFYTDGKASPTGIQYAHPTNYVTQAGSLTTKQWVEEAIAAASGGLTTGDKGDITVNTLTNWTVDNNAVTYAKMQDVSALRFLGRSASTSGDPQEITMATATSMLNNFSSTLKGLVPASGGGTTNFLRADGTWAAPPSSSGGSGTVNTDATQVAYGTGTNTVGGEAAFTYNATSNTLGVDAIDINSTPTNNELATQMLVRNSSTGVVEYVNMFAGTYTPTYTSISGGANGFENYPANYTRIGNNVTISGTIDFNHDNNAALLWVRMALPTDASFVATYSLAGGASSNQDVGVTIQGNGATGEFADFRFWGTVAGTSTVITYTLQYTTAN